MASSRIRRRVTSSGETRYRVVYRLGGRESTERYGGSFPTKTLALKRKAWIDGELAYGRVPALDLVDMQAVALPTVREVAGQWRASRIDVSAGTAQTYATNLDRVLPTLGSAVAAEVTAADVAALVVELHDRGLKRESIRKTLSTLAQALDFAKATPNPARDSTVKLPADESEKVNPPTAAHVEDSLAAIPNAYRLPVLVLDATGMRVGELEALRWRDVDEREGRWRVSRARAKTRQGRWVPVPQTLLDAVLDAVPREDRDLDGQVFAGLDADALRTSLGRACKAAGVPAFSPHDLRHRRASLWHLGGMPVAEACSKLGHSPQVHLGLYAHVVLDRRELDYAEALKRDRAARPSVRPRAVVTA
jgi:integrase